MVFKFYRKNCSPRHEGAMCMFMGNFLNFTMPSGVIGGLQNVSCIQTLLLSIIIYSSGMKTLVLRILIQDGK